LHKKFACLIDKSHKSCLRLAKRNLSSWQEQSINGQHNKISLFNTLGNSFEYLVAIYFTANLVIKLLLAVQESRGDLVMRESTSIAKDFAEGPSTIHEQP